MDKLIRKINSTSPKPKPKLSRSKVFGVPLKLLLVDSKSVVSHIPAIVTNLCQCLLKHGIEVEGIFRINGSARLIELFKRELEFSPSSDLCPTENVEIYALAGVLKLFLRELPDGVVPEEYTLKLIKEIQGDGEDVIECLQRLQALIPSLPRENRRLLHYLCCFLNKIAANEAFNKMSCQGLGILFGPCIFRFDVRSQGLRNQGLVNQAMTVLIEYCDTIFRPDHTDETFALGDDLTDSWRSAASMLGSDSFELKVRSMTCCSPSTCVSRSFYSTLFSGQSNEHLTSERADLLPCLDPPTLFSSSEYKAVKPLHQAPWSTLSNRSDLATGAQMKHESASITFNSALSSANSQEVSNHLPGHLTSDNLLFGSNNRRTTTTTISSTSSQSEPPANLKTHSLQSDSHGFKMSETQVPKSESGNNFLNDFHLSDSSNQLALDLTHLLTSFGSSKCMDLPVGTKPTENSTSNYNRAMSPPNMQQFPLQHSESDGLHSEDGVNKANKRPPVSNFIRQQQQTQQTHDAQPPRLIVSRPSTCGDHEPLVLNERRFSTAGREPDYERALYELASTLPESSNTTAATMSVKTIPISCKVPDEPSDVDLFGPDSLAPDSWFTGWPGADTTTTMTTTSTFSATPTPCAPLADWNQAIHACLDAHVFTAVSTKQDLAGKPLQRRNSLPHIYPVTTRSARSRLQLAPRARKAGSSTSSLPLLLNAQRLRNRQSSNESLTADSKSPLATKQQPCFDTPDFPSRPMEDKPTVSRSNDSLSKTNGQVKSSPLPRDVGLSSRAVSAPSIVLSSPPKEENSVKTSPKRKYQPKMSSTVLNPNRPESIRKPQWHVKSSQGPSLNMSTSAPPTPRPDSTPNVIPRAHLRSSASCSPLSRSCDRKIQKNVAHRRHRRRTGNEPHTRKGAPLVRSSSFHYLPLRIKGPHLFVIPKATSFHCIPGSLRHRSRWSTRSSKNSRKAKSSRPEEPNTAVGQQLESERQLREALNTSHTDNRNVMMASTKRESQTPFSFDDIEPITAAEGVTTGASLQAFCELLTAVLEEQRRCCGRPNMLAEMNSDQILQEKVDLQKGLLYFERLHGRPNDSESKRIMKPLYERYRQVKRLLRTLDVSHAVEQDVAATNCLEVLETSFQLTPRVAPHVFHQNSPPLDSPSPLVLMPVVSHTPLSRVGSTRVPKTLSPLSVRTKHVMSCLSTELETSRISDSAPPFDWNESSLLVSPQAESNSHRFFVLSQSEQKSGLINPLMGSCDSPNKYVVSNHRTVHPTNLNRDELLTEWKHILGKKRALQRELREFEICIEQVKGRPPDKIDRGSMRDKYQEYRSLKRTLETLALHLNMEPTLSCAVEFEPSDQQMRMSHRTTEPDVTTPASPSAI